MEHREPPEDPEDPFDLRADPGWRPRSAGDRPDGLVAVRMVFLAICAGLVAVGVVVGLVAGDPDRSPGSVGLGPAALAVVVVGVLALVAVRFVPLTLDCADELALARSWRSRFFARVAAAQVAALVGFGAAVLAGTPALYPLGLLFTVAGLAYAGPFHATFVRDQQQLALEGCPIPLVPALRHPVTPDTR